MWQVGASEPEPEAGEGGPGADRSWLRSGNKVPGLRAGGSRVLLSLPLPDLCNRILVQPVCGAAWASAFLTSSQETLLRCSGTTLRAERGLTRQTVWI